MTKRTTTMDHRTCTNWLILALYDELDADARALLDEHLASCSACREEQARLAAFHTTASKRRPVADVDRLLQDARRDRRIGWRLRDERRSPLRGILETLDTVLAPAVRLAAGGLFLLLAGFGAAWLLLRSGDSGRFVDPAGIVQASGSRGSMEQGEIQIQNVRFVVRDQKSGDVEVTFESVTPLRVRGNVNDERIQRVLARALVGEVNPGTRLRAVNMLADRTDSHSTVEAHVKQALISALKYDPNYSVRKEALSVLENYVPDPEVVQAILYVLAKEKNTGMKVAAINALDPKKLGTQTGSSDLVQGLRQAADNEENAYIRIRALAALKEVHQ
jgi:hypothetical protein